MFSGTEYSVDRLVEIMHIRGIQVLHGFEPLSTAMLRSSSGYIPLFEQEFIIDLDKDTMDVYNNDQSSAYHYKYSDLRQYFFERDIVCEVWYL
jgi:hypothetical protein